MATKKKYLCNFRKKLLVPFERVVKIMFLLKIIQQLNKEYSRYNILNLAKIADFSRFLQKLVIFGKFKILYLEYHLFNRCVILRRYIIFTALSFVAIFKTWQKGTIKYYGKNRRNMSSEKLIKVFKSTKGSLKK